ncbi:hypothetical protein QL285_074833 [Trifolium repens]|nr:hypothetical protein QL285_074833 [Trifolium repens]
MMDSLLASLIFVLRHLSKSIKMLLLPVIWLEHPESKYHTFDLSASEFVIDIRSESSESLPPSSAYWASSLSESSFSGQFLA